MVSFEEWDEGRIRLHHGDCRELVASLPDGSVDAVVTDPPYELGFMGRAWDRSGVAFDPGLWRDVLRVVKPGGHLLAFGAARTYHRLACAVEDAGFEIRGQIDWVYASGMPHGSDASLLVDRSLGAGRTGAAGHATRTGAGCSDAGGSGVSMADGGDTSRGCDVRAPVTPEAGRWAGWNTQLKPAHEPICLARKPLEGTLAGNLLEWGTGALHVDACRVPVSDAERAAYRRRWDGPRAASKTRGIYGRYAKAGAGVPSDLGRFPPDMLFDTAVAAVLDSGMDADRDDPGGAGRFFPVFRYEAKAGAGERPQVDGVIHPTVKPLGLMRWLVRLAVPRNGLVLEPFAGSGTTLEACRLEDARCVAAELDADYLPLIRGRLARPVTPALL